MGSFVLKHRSELAVFILGSLVFRVFIFGFLIPGRTAAHFLIHFPAQHQRDHFLVGPPRPQRVLKRGRPVVLHEEVRNPRQRVRNHERERNPPPASQRDRGHQQRPARQRPRKMNCSRAGLTVRAHIFGPERCEICLGVHKNEHRNSNRNSRKPKSPLN